MALTFPIRPRGPATPGMPERASHCRCGRGQLVDQPLGTCIRCGKYPLDVIAETWQHRAMKVADANRARQARKQTRRQA